jgi:hypothetical protein
MTASRRLTDGPTSDGTKAYAEVAMGPVKLGWTYEIRDFRPNGGFAFTTITRNALGMDGSIRLTPSGVNATKVDYHVEILTPRSCCGSSNRSFRSEMSRNEAGELDRLKEQLETRPAIRPEPIRA